MAQVTSYLITQLGGEAVAEHFGVFQSTELSRFRNNSCEKKETERQK